jgi:hypothetical protein
VGQPATGPPAVAERAKQTGHKKAQKITKKKDKKMNEYPSSVFYFRVFLCPFVASLLTRRAPLRVAATRG